MVKRLVCAFSVLSSVLLTAACGDDVEPRTQLLLVADTDVEGARSIEFRIVGAGRDETRESTFSGPDELPRTLAFVRDKAPLGPYTVTASLEVDGERITRSHEVSFVPGQTLVVPLHLAQACSTLSCPEQCGEQGCVDTVLEAGDLARYPSGTGRAFTDGTPDASSGDPDASSGDPDASTNEPDAGDDGPDAGDEPVKMCGGQLVDTSSDAAHCGRCDNRCKITGPGRNADGIACVSGECVLVCKAGFGDCNGRQTDGCEENLTSSNKHCGTCGVTCDMGSSCMQSECTN